MSSLILALVLTSAVVHATWNLWLKQIGPRPRSGTLMWMLTSISALLYAPVALWALAHGAWRPDRTTLIFVAGSALFHVAYFLLLLRGYRRSDLSVVYPVARGTGPLLAAAGAVAWMGDRVSPLSVTGAALVATGVLVLTLRPGLASDRRLGAGLRYGLATGVTIALYTLWDGWAVQRAGLPPLVYYWGGEMVRVLLFTPAAVAARGDLGETWRSHRWRVFGIAALSPLSYLLILLALRTGRVSTIAPAREISILIGTVLGGHVLGEGQRTRRVVAAAAFVAGVIALAVA
jgi:drug/metabolite transporter (DMT)-like permease